MLQLVHLDTVTTIPVHCSEYQTSVRWSSLCKAPFCIERGGALWGQRLSNWCTPWNRSRRRRCIPLLLLLWWRRRILLLLWWRRRMLLLWWRRRMLLLWWRRGSPSGRRLDFNHRTCTSIGRARYAHLLPSYIYNERLARTHALGDLYLVPLHIESFFPQNPPPLCQLDTITHPYTRQPTNRTLVNLATITPSQPTGFLRDKNR
mmetsp:Transcript_22722/g.36208  ORF Transcript_22722/g.36208 Transcript_22722/m.36208 type:complete len:204 (-) Transcript_22722:1027-1638(-)